MAGLLDRFAAWNDLDPDWVGGLREVTAEELRDAIRLGTVVNHVDETGALVEISWDSDYTGAFVGDPVPTARIDSDTLALVLRSYSGLSRSDTLDRPALQFDPRGLRMRHVVIVPVEGTVPLHNLTLPFPLAFEGCIFEGFVSVNHSVLPRLDFDTCLFLGARSTMLLDRATITGSLTFFQCEGLRQLFAPDAVIGEFSVRSDGLLMPAGGQREFSTNLMGARIDALYLEGDPHRIMPAGSCAGLEIGSVTLATDDPKLTKHHRWKADWMAKWLSGGTPPAWWRRLSSWGPGATQPHHRSAWNSAAAALSRAGSESLSRFGLSYVDQGTRLQLLAERHRDSKLAWWPRMLRWLSLDLTVRYFTANIRALGGLTAVWLVVTMLAWIRISDLWRGSNAGPAPAGPLESGFEGVLWAGTYGLNFVVSPLDLGFSAVWPTGIGFLVTFALLKLVAIILFGLFIVGISGVVSRARAER